MNADSEKQNGTDMLDQVLGDIPEEDSPAIKLILQSMQISRMVSPNAELMKKVTSENISEITKVQEKEIELSFKESRDAKVFQAVVAMIVCFLVVGMIILLKDQPDLLERLLTPIITLVIGGIGGYGYGKSKRDE